MRLPIAICLIAASYFVVAVSCAGRTPGLPELSDSAEVAVDLVYIVVPREKPSFWDSVRALGAAKPNMKLIVNLPQTIKGKQEITKLVFEPSPSRVFIENCNKYAEYVLSPPKKKTKIKIQIEAKVFRYDLATATNNPARSYVRHSDLDSFLQQERMIEKDEPAVQKIAQTIRGQTQLETVKNIYKYIIRNLTMDASKLKGVGAARTALTKKGMCIDYCDLFVALCRAKNIPARVVGGYKTHFRVSPKHSWVEVCLKEHGWVPFDVSVAHDIPEEYLNWEFHHLRPRYLYFTNLRSDPVLHNNYFYCWPYWDKDIRKAVKVYEFIEFTKPLHEIHDSIKDLKRTRKTEHTE